MVQGRGFLHLATVIDAMREVIRLSRDMPFNVSLHLRRIMFGPFYVARLRLMGVRVGKRVQLFGCPIIRRWRDSDISIGTGSELRSSPSSNVLGLSHPVVLSTMTSTACIEIGDYCGLSGATLCAASRISLGPNCLIGADVLVTDNDHHALLAEMREVHSLEGVSVRPVTIGANVFIGARAIVLKGVSIGVGAVVGAGSVVTEDVPSYAVALGNPARVVRFIERRPPA